MVHISSQYCITCKEMTEHSNQTGCGKCSVRAQKEAEDRWNSMTIDEKLNLLRDKIISLSNITDVF